MTRLEREIGRLNRLVDDFAADMKEKLEAKACQGWGGWSDAQIPLFVERMRGHAVQNEPDPIDVANFCAFIWNLQRPGRKVRRTKKEGRA